MNTRGKIANKMKVAHDCVYLVIVSVASYFGMKASF